MRRGEQACGPFARRARRSLRFGTAAVGQREARNMLNYTAKMPSQRAHWRREHFGSFNRSHT